MLTRRSKLADLIEDKLKRTGIEKKDLADAIKITPASISKWLRRDRPEAIPPLHWKGICRFLGIPLKTWLRVAQADRPQDFEKFERLVSLLSGR